MVDFLIRHYILLQKELPTPAQKCLNIVLINVGLIDCYGLKILVHMILDDEMHIIEVVDM